MNLSADLTQTFSKMLWAKMIWFKFSRLFLLQMTLMFQPGYVELSLRHAYSIILMTQKAANPLTSLSPLTPRVCIVLVALVNFQKVQVQSIFDSKLEKFWITPVQPFLSSLPKSDKSWGKSQSGDGVLTRQFTFRDLNSQNILKSQVETKKFLDIGWSKAGVTGRMSFAQEVFVGEPEVNVGTKATIIPYLK